MHTSEPSQRGGSRINLRSPALLFAIECILLIALMVAAPFWTRLQIGTQIEPDTLTSFAEGMATASSIIAGLAGVVVIFFITAKERIYKYLRRQLEKSFVAQMVMQVCFPLASLAVALAALLIPLGWLRSWLLIASVVFLLTGVVYQLAFFYLAAEGSVKQDEADAREARTRELESTLKPQNRSQNAASSNKS